MPTNNPPTPNMNLAVWPDGDDYYDHTELANNFSTLDAHDHTAGRGRQIVASAIATAAVETAKIKDQNVTRAKLADGVVGSDQIGTGEVKAVNIADNSVSGVKIADGAVTSQKLDPNVIPLGTIVPWWRPNTGTPVPAGGWEVADGRAITTHDFPGGGTINLPDLRNRFLLGAAEGGTGTLPTQPPVIGQTGGTNEANLGHNHTVAHNHAVPAHDHDVLAHAHALKAHTHDINGHDHTVNSHTHTVGSHTHPVSAHSHGMDHTHTVNNHNHGIADGGTHDHSFNSAVIVGHRDPDHAGGNLTCLVPSTLAHDQQFYVNNGGSHNHGGGTNYSAPGTGGTRTSTDNAGATATGSSAFSTGGPTDQGTSSRALTTNAQSSAVQFGTENATGKTANSVVFDTTTVTPTTSTSLAAVDIRPRYAGVLYLVKVRN